MLNFIKAFFSFNFPTLAGLVVGFWLYSLHSERQPLSTFLTESYLYIILFLLVLAFRLIIWLLLDKASLRNIKKLALNIIQDTIILTLVTLSTVGFLFLFNTFVLKYL